MLLQESLFFRFSVKKDAFENARSAFAGDGCIDNTILATLHNFGHLMAFSLK